MTRAKLFRHDQRGETSMVTVGMFMMLFSIVVVSFTYMAINAARVTTNDTLQSTAKAAAESGVEDAKRLLVYCYSNYTGGNPQMTGSYNSATAGRVCSQVIGHTVDSNVYGCNSILKASYDNSSTSPLGNIEKEGGDYRTSVGEAATTDGTSREYYQCLEIGTLSKNYIGVANEGKSLVIPLYLTDINGNRQPVSTITVKWHKNATAEGDSPASGITSNNGLSNKSEWNDVRYNRPAVMRAEVLFVPEGSTSVNDLIRNDYALTLRPSLRGTGSVGMTNYSSVNRNTPNVQRVPFEEAHCTNNANSNDYACEVALVVNDANGNNATNLGYLRLLATYKSAHVEVTAKDRSGNDLYFDGVQPVVDVTGRSSDAFARIEARLKPQSNDDNSASSWFPEYAVQTDGQVCKQLNVFWEDGEDNCNY